jgi:TPR repeat protein
VTKNLEEAAKWYQKAAERGDLDAVRVLRKMNLTSYIS